MPAECGSLVCLPVITAVITHCQHVVPATSRCLSIDLLKCVKVHMSPCTLSPRPCTKHCKDTHAHQLTCPALTLSTALSANSMISSSGSTSVTPSLDSSTSWSSGHSCWWVTCGSLVSRGSGVLKWKSPRDLQHQEHDTQWAGSGLADASQPAPGTAHAAAEYEHTTPTTEAS